MIIYHFNSLFQTGFLQTFHRVNQQINITNIMLLHDSNIMRRCAAETPFQCNCATSKHFSYTLSPFLIQQRISVLDPHHTLASYTCWRNVRDLETPMPPVSQSLLRASPSSPLRSPVSFQCVHTWSEIQEPQAPESPCNIFSFWLFAK